MPKYIALLDFTEKGLAEIRDTARRAEAFASDAKKLGVDVDQIFWTVGPHDGVLIFDAPDEATSNAVLLSLCQHGFVRSKTLRAFGRDEIEPIIAKIGS